MNSTNKLGCLVFVGLAAVELMVVGVPRAQAGADGDAATGEQLDEIMVTAQRRSERNQDVPISVAVVSADLAEKLGNTDTLSLPTLTPSLVTSRQVTGFSTYLRGVGSISSPGNEVGIATYVDDVYITGFSSNVVSFNNIDQIEVLKGPQGTLFGRNATGGVIHVITKDPSDTSQLNVQVGYANYNTFSSSVYGTTGLGHDMAVDIAYFSRDQKSGWGSDLATNQPIDLGEEYGVRSKLKWTPGDGTTVILEADHYYTDYDYGAQPSAYPGTLSIGGGTFVGNYNAQAINAFSGGKSGNDSHVDGQTITIDHDFGWSTLRSVTAARRAYSVTLYDQDLGPLNVDSLDWLERLAQYTEEVRLSSPSNAQIAGHNLHWQGGVFAMKLNDALDPLRVQGASLGGLHEFDGVSRSYTKSYAGFLDGTLALTHTTNLTLGARYTEDRISNDSFQVYTAADGTNSGTPTTQLHTTAGKPTYRAVLDQKLTDDVMAYASVSSGFKSGGYSLFAGGTPPTQPEELDAYALGLKTEWLDRKLQLNAEAFDYKYKHQQVEVIVAGGVFDINAAQSRIYGLDLNAAAKPFTDLTITLNYGYLHGRYLSFPGAPVYLQQPATCSPTPMRLPGALIAGDTLCDFDAAGKPTIRSPTNSGNVGVNYVIFRGAQGTVEGAANYYRTSSFDWDPSGQYPEPGYGLLDASLTWHSPTEKYDIQGWCSNCSGTYHDTFIAESVPGEQRAGDAPREYGIRFGAHFK